jgi:hypothetical protein
VDRAEERAPLGLTSSQGLSALFLFDPVPSREVLRDRRNLAVGTLLYVLRHRRLAGEQTSRVSPFARISIVDGAQSV